MSPRKVQPPWILLCLYPIAELYRIGNLKTEHWDAHNCALGESSTTQTPVIILLRNHYHGATFGTIYKKFLVVLQSQFVNRRVIE